MRNKGAEQARAETQTKEVSRRLGLDWLEYKVEYSSVVSEAAASTIASSSWNWFYRQGEMTWFLPQVAQLEDKEIRDTAIHEFVHALIDPIWGELSDEDQKRLDHHMELATENVARALVHVLDTRPFPD